MIASLLRTGKAEFDGRYSWAHGGELRPRGVRPGGPPLLIGGTGPRMLRATARHADLWNGCWFGDPAGFAPALHTVREACAAVGRDPATLRITAGVNVVPTARAEPPDPRRPVLGGTPADLAAGLAGYRDSASTTSSATSTPTTRRRSAPSPRPSGATGASRTRPRRNPFHDLDDLYDLIAEALTAHLAASVRYPDHLALPGFHIWLEAAIFTRPRAPVHFDIQHQAFDWPPGTDTDRLLSFALPLRVPAAGGGLNLWEATYQDFRRSLARGWVVSAADLQRFHARRYVPCTPGRLYVHSGHVLHQVAPSAGVRAGDERLTLQGHGVWCADHWQLYW